MPLKMGTLVLDAGNMEPTGKQPSGQAPHWRHAQARECLRGSKHSHCDPGLDSACPWTGAQGGWRADQTQYSLSCIASFSPNITNRGASNQTHVLTTYYTLHEVSTAQYLLKFCYPPAQLACLKKSGSFLVLSLGKSSCHYRH